MNSDFLLSNRMKMNSEHPQYYPMQQKKYEKNTRTQIGFDRPKVWNQTSVERKKNGLC